MIYISTITAITNLFSYFKEVARGSLQNKLYYLPESSYNQELTSPRNYTSLLNAYKSWVYVCANRNATMTASFPLKLYVAKPNNSKTLVRTRSISRETKKHLYSIGHLDRYLRKAVEVEEVLEHPFLDLMKNVNPFMDENELKETTTLHQDLTGNAFWYLLKNNLGLPAEIWLVPPDKVKIVPSKENFINGYVYSQGLDKVPFDTSEIVHFKYPSPTSAYYGAGCLAAVTYAYDINLNMDKYETNMFANMGRPEGYLKTDQALDDKEFKRLKRLWSQEYGGVKGAGKTAILEKGLEYKPITLTPRELNFLSGRKITKEEIFNAFGIPLGLFSEESNRANSEMANYNYMSGTIAPRHRRQEGKINEMILPLYDERLFCAYDDCIPENEMLEHKRRVDNVKEGIISRNEAREEEGKDALDELDKIYISNTLVPIGTMSEAETEELSKKIIDKVKEKLAKT